MSKLNPGRKPNLYVIAGPNGAGKTTFARKFLPEYARCFEFVNADLIAGGLSPFTPERAAVRAGRIMIDQIRRISAQRVISVLKQPSQGSLTLTSFRTLREKGIVFISSISGWLALTWRLNELLKGSAWEAMIFRQTQSVADLLKAWPTLLDYIGPCWILGTFMIIQWKPQNWSPSRDTE
jgi:hypothetical protein